MVFSIFQPKTLYSIQRSPLYITKRRNWRQPICADRNTICTERRENGCILSPLNASPWPTHQMVCLYIAGFLATHFIDLRQGINLFCAPNSTLKHSCLASKRNTFSMAYANVANHRDRLASIWSNEDEPQQQKTLTKGINALNNETHRNYTDIVAIIIAHTMQATRKLYSSYRPNEERIISHAVAIEFDCEMWYELLYWCCEKGFPSPPRNITANAIIITHTHTHRRERRTLRRRRHRLGCCAHSLFILSLLLFVDGETNDCKKNIV